MVAMSTEATKLRERWQREGIWEKYFGNDKSILDIGSGPDPITPWARGWDIVHGDGDGQKLAGVDDNSYDIVFSSHFIEHLHDPLEGLLNQWRVLRPGGYLIFQLPDEDLYEQGIWPSKYNDDHKHTWTISKAVTWSPASRNIVDYLKFLPNHKVISMRIIDTGYDYNRIEIIDQSNVPGVEIAVEVIILKQAAILTHQCNLKHKFLCERCGHMEFVCRGQKEDGSYDIYCKFCGRMGIYIIHAKPTG